jgi:hypothetical protein
MTTPCDRHQIAAASGEPALPPTLLHLVGGEARVLVFPDANRQPAHLLQLSVNTPVALSISFQFLTPPVRICLGHRPVLRTAVPETAIHEYGNSRPAEDEVRGTRESPLMGSITKPAGVQDPTKPQLGPRVLPWHALHLLRHLPAACHWPVELCHEGILA